MKSNNFVVIQGWMCNELNLKGNELLVFALIYGFCQDEESQFSGSRNYIAETFNITLPTVDKALESLKEQQLIEVFKASNNHCTYKVSLQVLVKFLYNPCKVSLHNNISNTQKEKAFLSKDKNAQFNFGSNQSKSKKPTLYEKCVSVIDNFTNDSTLRELLITALRQFLDNSKESSRPFYTNNFVGKLNHLKALTDDHGYTDVSLAIKIVQQTLDKGWNDFYDLKQDKNKKAPATDMGYGSERANKKGKVYEEY